MRASEVARPAFVSLAIFLLATAVGVTATAAGLRVLGPSDLLRIEELGEVALSPDGQYLAYVLKRSKAAAGAAATSRPYPLRHDRAMSGSWLARGSRGS